MIPAPFVPVVGSALLMHVGWLALVAAGLVALVGQRRFAGRLIRIGLFLAVMACLLPYVIH